MSLHTCSCKFWESDSPDTCSKFILHWSEHSGHFPWYRTKIGVMWLLMWFLLICRNNRNWIYTWWFNRVSGNDFLSLLSLFSLFIFKYVPINDKAAAYSHRNTNLMLSDTLYVRHTLFFCLILHVPSLTASVQRSYRRSLPRYLRWGRTYVCNHSASSLHRSLDQRPRGQRSLGARTASSPGCWGSRP